MSKKPIASTITFPGSQPVVDKATQVVLTPRRLCETRNGDLAFSLGRLRFHRGRPMLVEHMDGLYLEHALCGRVLTCGYGDEFDIMHIFTDDNF